MSDETRMTLLHSSTNNLVEELLMWRGRAAELLDRIAELEEQVWNLNLANEKLESAYFADETIAPDGTLKPSVRKLLERLEKSNIDCDLAESHVTALLNRITELEAENERFTVHSDIERQDDKCSGHGDISNFPPVMGSGDGLGW